MPLCGPRVADFLDLIGVETFEELADCDADMLAMRISAALGRPHINKMGVRALANAIAAARSARTDEERTAP